ncbi:MAG: alpha-glucan family phosphorylase [Pyrinomonadaceae bacterium]|nr:alpha-glucan family phosphorylase [Pyrinomonadaceae bacterium]
MTTENLRFDLPPSLAGLERVARNFWWSWNNVSIFRDLDEDLWIESEQNPLVMLQKISSFKLWQRANDPDFVVRVNEVANQFDAYKSQYSHNFGRITGQTPVAYFCAEYGVHNSLPLYSGGLGILAGDHLKSASDMNLPLVAIGLYYRFGYFRQKMSADGLQLENYFEAKPENTAVEKVIDENGEPLKIVVRMRGRDVAAQVWLANIGRVKLYLLDTDVLENEEIDRHITGYLYGGDKETRVTQEMLLGIGGVRLLRKLNISPSVYHLNEGHSAFLTLELAREMTESEDKLSFSDAAPLVKAQCVFTTHTPVPAGNDEFAPEIIEKCFDESYIASLGLSKNDFLALGRIDSTNDKLLFGLSPLALRMTRKANGVSEKHGEVSREMWQPLFATEPENVPITFVTNGVHAPTWIAPILQNLYKQNFGENWKSLLEDKESWTAAIEKLSDEDLFRVHNSLKNLLVEYIRTKTGNAEIFTPNALTIGFARRIAAYKRWNLLLSQPERLLKLIDNAEKPVQFVFAGKAHPQDNSAKLILQQIVKSRGHETFARHAVFLEDYDQEMSRYIVQGVDVWLNVPRRPLEASGTSGQKAGMNGALNFSILDGWWIEGYNEKNGWAIGENADLSDKFDEKEIDLQDANSLFETLETQIAPKFFDRDENGLPKEWLAMMRNALQTLTPQFSSDRMLKHYIEQIYNQ